MVNKNKGFTLIEILIVIGIIIILATGIIISLNPGRQYAKSRDAIRAAHLQSIMSAIYQNIASNNGKFVCSSGDIPSVATTVASGSYNLAPCLIPTFTQALGVDPQTGTWVDQTNYNTRYEISKDTTTNRITLSAPDAEIDRPLTITQ